MSAEKTRARLATPTDLGGNATKDISGALNALLADTFALYLKTKNFHWHVSGPNFRDYHLMLGSPAIDAADPAATTTTDFDGTARPQGSARDIGAFEYKP